MVPSTKKKNFFRIYIVSRVFHLYKFKISPNVINCMCLLFSGTTARVKLLFIIKLKCDEKMRMR